MNTTPSSGMCNSGNDNIVTDPMLGAVLYIQFRQYMINGDYTRARNTIREAMALSYPPAFFRMACMLRDGVIMNEAPDMVVWYYYVAHGRDHDERAYYHLHHEGQGNAKTALHIECAECKDKTTFDDPYVNAMHVIYDSVDPKSKLQKNVGKEFNDLKRCVDEDDDVEACIALTTFINWILTDTVAAKRYNGIPDWDDLRALQREYTLKGDNLGNYTCMLDMVNMTHDQGKALQSYRWYKKLLKQVTCFSTKTTLESTGMKRYCNYNRWEKCVAALRCVIAIQQFRGNEFPWFGLLPFKDVFVERIVVPIWLGRFDECWYTNARVDEGFFVDDDESD